MPTLRLIIVSNNVSKIKGANEKLIKAIRIRGYEDINAGLGTATAQ
jgi:hypothetical protein